MISSRGLILKDLNEKHKKKGKTCCAVRTENIMKAGAQKKDAQACGAEVAFSF